ncbi:MAG: multidrug efflux RND transporter permease subunit [Phycisphaerales bacterium]|nr:multidrug efflux RND transporter permease subunit [Phycisphaerales bacterium]
MLSILVVIAGMTSLVGLPIAEYPNLAPPTIAVSAVYPGADAQVIADTVAAPIEQQINGVAGMMYMKSTCSSDGQYQLSVTFETGTDLDMASVQVQNLVSGALSKLPEDVQRQGVSVTKKMPDFALAISVTSPDGQFDDVYLSNYATLNIRDQIKRIDGVGDVGIFGAAEYSMRIWLDHDKLLVRNATAGDVLSAIRQQNVQVAAGKIGEPPAELDTAFQYTVTTKGRLSDPEEFANIAIRTDEDGRVLRVGDIARVELGAQMYAISSKTNGKPAAVLILYQLPGANLIDISDGVQETISNMRANIPQGMDVQIVYDASNVVRASISEIVVTLVIASILVILTVLIFLQDFRATLIPAIAIPVSLIGAFAAMNMLGFTLNTLTLFGLVLAIGIVVDDAIVVVENVARNLDESDMSPRDAATKAMKEVTGPVVATTLVLLAVFVPTSFMSGITGVMYRQFGLTIAAATIFSSINALTLSPALCALIIRKSKKRKNFIFRIFDGAISKSTPLYTSLVRWSLRLAVLTILVFVGIVGLGVQGFSSLPTGFVPPEDKGILMVVAQLPSAASRQRTHEVSAKIEKILSEVPGIEYYITIEGNSLITGAASPDAVSFIVALEPWDKRTSPGLKQDAIVGQLWGRFAEIQEAFTIAFGTPPIPGVGTTGGFDMQIQDQAGLGTQTLAQMASELAGKANSQSGLSNVSSSFRATVPQLFVDIDRSKVQQLGVSMQAVFDTLQANLGGSYANDFNTLNRTFQVRVQADSQYRAHPEDILKLKLRDSQGRSIPLAALATVQESFGPSTISRYNLYPAASITGSPAAGFSSGQAMEMMEAAASENLPQGMSYEWTGLAFQEKQASGGVVMVFGLAVLLVYLVLAAQYESYILPLSIILVVPLGFIGVVAGAQIRGFDNNVYTQIGVVLLVAMICKNAILIVEFAKEKHEGGMKPRDAALEAARLRFRPILMTAFSFVLGTAPLVIATGAGAGARTALGTAVFFGMVLATLFGVVITPVIYRVVQGSADRFKRNAR